MTWAKDRTADGDLDTTTIRVRKSAALGVQALPFTTAEVLPELGLARQPRALGFIRGVSLPVERYPAIVLKKLDAMPSCRIIERFFC